MGAAQDGSCAKFASTGAGSAEERLKTEVVGLVTYQDYKRKREALEVTNPPPPPPVALGGLICNGYRSQQ